MDYRSECPIARTLDLIGDRWSLLVIRDALVRDCRTFGDFAASDEKIPTNILSARLKRLVENGLLVKEPYQQRPVRYAYRPTETCEALRPVIKAMFSFGVTHLGGRRDGPK